jgi:hypothetical protein
MYSVRDDSDGEAEPDSLDQGSCAGRCGKLATDDAQPHPSTSSPQRTRSQTNVRCGPLCGIGTRDTSSASVGTTRAWPIFDPSHFVRCVRRVRDPAQNGRSGRGRTHMAWANKVEGLVDFTVRGGSSPLARISGELKVANRTTLEIVAKLDPPSAWLSLRPAPPRTLEAYERPALRHGQDKCLLEPLAARHSARFVYAARLTAVRASSPLPSRLLISSTSKRPGSNCAAV